jgi:hypothetical protein
MVCIEFGCVHELSSDSINPEIYLLHLNYLCFRKIFYMARRRSFPTKCFHFCWFIGVQVWKNRRSLELIDTDFPVDFDGMTLKLL